MKLLNVSWRFNVLQEAGRVQPQLFRQPWQKGQPLSSIRRQHHSKDGATSAQARKTVLFHMRWCSPPPPQFNRSPRLGVWCHPHGSRQVFERVVRSKRSRELLDDGIGRPHACDGCRRGLRRLCFGVGIILDHISCKHTPRAAACIVLFGVCSHITRWLDEQCHRSASCERTLRNCGDRGCHFDAVQGVASIKSTRTDAGHGRRNGDTC